MSAAQVPPTLGYIAQKTFKVKGFDGAYRSVHKGDWIPEAATWPNVEMYESQGWVRLQPVAVSPPSEAAPDIPAQPTRKKSTRKRVQKE